MTVLSAAQQQALDIANHVFVKAAAGAGKTTILVNRFLSILAEPDLRPDHILAITYTKKAAEEMKHRLRPTLRAALGQTRIDTIHAFCLSVLRYYPFEAGLTTGFRTLDGTQGETLKKMAIERTFQRLKAMQDPHFVGLLTHVTPVQMMTYVRRLFGLASQLGSLTHPHPQTHALCHIFDACYREFKQLKQARNVIDYDDQIQLTKQVLAQHQRARSDWATQLRYIMVDEFQDTNDDQWQLIQQLLPQALESVQPNLFVVGDDKQSIYSFQGADARIFNHVNAAFDQSTRARVVSADDNYRCHQPVVRAVNHLFSAIFGSAYRPMIGHREDLGEVTWSCATDASALRLPQRVGIMVARLRDYRQLDPTIRYRDVAILCRKKSQFADYKRLFAQWNIPIQVHDGYGFYQTQEIVDIIALIQALNNPSNHGAWVALLQSVFFRCSSSMVQVLMAHSSPNWITKLADIAPEWATIVEGWKAMIDLYSPAVVLTHILDEHRLWAHYAAQPNSTQIVANVTKLVHWVDTQVRRNPDMSWGELETWLTDAMWHHKSEPEGGVITDDQDAIQLMSIHAAKGLEFPVVFLPELDSLFNYGQRDPIVVKDGDIGLRHRTGDEQNPIYTDVLSRLKTDVSDEEKRLFYVACTRAKTYLHLMGVYPESVSDNPKSMMDYLATVLTITPDGRLMDQADASLSYRNMMRTAPLDVTDDEPTPVVMPDTNPANCIGEVPVNRYSGVQLTTSQIVTILTQPEAFTHEALVSALQGVELHHDRRFSDSGSSAEFGVLVHALFDWIVRYPNRSVSQSFASMLNRQTRLYDRAMEWRQRLVAVGDQFMSSALVQQMKSMTECFTEYAFTVRFGLVGVSGRFDCVMNNGSDWLLVDYKTDQVSVLPTALPVAYDMQMKMYCLAVQRCFGSSQSMYSVFVYYTAVGDHVMVTYSADELAEFESQIEHIPALVC